MEVKRAMQSDGVFADRLNAAGDTMRRFAVNTGAAAAEDLADAFEAAGARIAVSMARATGSGEASIKKLAKIALEELAKVALDRIRPGASQSGRSAASSSIGREGGYAQSGPVIVHFHVASGDGSGWSRHQGQIGAAIARAVSYGRRNL